MEPTNPARLYALCFGAVLVLAGLIGFLYNGSFAVGDDVPRDAVLGVLDVNAWHNLVHLVTGVLGLAAASSLVASRAYAFGARSGLRRRGRVGCDPRGRWRDPRPDPD